jgi:alkylation response protein AidB-like acyl-CoA dehydrogenase
VTTEVLHAWERPVSSETPHDGHGRHGSVAAFSLGEECPPEEYRARVRQFLAAELPEGWRGIGALSNDDRREFERSWMQTLERNGMRAPFWPQEYGGAGLGPSQQVVLAEEFAAAGVPMYTFIDVFGVEMLGPTLIAWGTEEQKRFFLPRILSGAHKWCQGFSEPGAGSDLANITTSAVLDGDDWVINGQKLWTSSAHLADWIFVLCRTSNDGPKHRGLSFLLARMDQPGIDVRPVRMMNGESEFNEVFFDDVRTPKKNIVGDVNNGWTVAMTLLGHERGGRATTAAYLYRAELDRIVQAARDRGRTDDPVVRDRLAWAHMHVELIRLTGIRTVERFLSGGEAGPESAIFKLLCTEYHKRVADLALDILGAEAMAPSGEAPLSAIPTDQPGGRGSPAGFVRVFLNSRAGTIYGGTSEVQRNIIGERVLGLPKEPR